MSIEPGAPLLLVCHTHAHMLSASEPWVQDVDDDGADELTNLISMIPEDQRYSDWWDHAPADGGDNGVGEHSQLDHLLVTPGLRSRVQRVWIDHGHNPADVSDHWPLMAELSREPVASGGGSCAGDDAEGVLEAAIGMDCTAAMAAIPQAPSFSGDVCDFNLSVWLRQDLLVRHICCASCGGG